MRLRDFKLEVYFEKYEFKAPYLLAQSDCESLSARELLELSGEGPDGLLDTWLGYTQVRGEPLLREKIAGLYESASMEDVLVHSGAEEAIFNFMNVFLEKGDHVICQFPVYQSLYEVARSIGCEVSPWELRQTAKGWEFDLSLLERLIRPETRLLVINNPNNPTGYLIDNGELWEIAALADRKGIFVFSDEVYRGLELSEETPKQRAFADICENSLSLGVMSKSYGLAGLRIGWIASHAKDIMESMTRYKHYTTICNSAPSEYLAERALECKEKILARNAEIIKNNITLAESLLLPTGLIRLNRPQAGPIAFNEYLGGDVDAFCEELLEETGVLLLPGSVYDFPGNYFRMGYGRSGFEEGLQRLKSFLTG